MYAQPTIKDVAKAAGVHFTTVSMALRGHPSIPAPTRERILAAASRVGYQRNQVFAALTNQRSQGGSRFFVPRIAYLTNRSPEEGFDIRAHYRSLVEGARRQSEALGYSLDLLHVDKGHHNSASLARYLHKHSIRGLIIGAFEPGREELELDWSEFCTIKIDSRHMEPAVSFVSPDQFNSVRESLARLRALGYRRIGLAVGEDDETGTDDMHRSGWLLAQSFLAPGEQLPCLVFPHGATVRSIVPLLRRYVREHRVDAVICNWTNIRSMLRQAGFDSPGEVACACICLSKSMSGLAGIVTNMDLVGQRAVSLLAAMLRSEQRGIPACATTTFVQGTWHDGSSAPSKS